MLTVVPTEAPKARSGGACHRHPYDRSLHCASLRSAPVGTTEHRTMCVHSNACAGTGSRSPLIFVFLKALPRGNRPTSPPHLNGEGKGLPSTARLVDERSGVQRFPDALWRGRHVDRLAAQ